MVKLVATDIDGTLTINRISTLIPTEVIEAIHELEKHGVLVALISSNALPIVVGLKKYLCIKGPVVGETGALVYHGGEVYSISKYTARDALEYVLKEFNDFVKPSWQNLFRVHDFALKVRKQYLSRSGEIYQSIKACVEKKYSFVKVGYSGYAIHLTPIDVSKGRALDFIIEKLGISREEVLAIGDSHMDIDFLRKAGISVAVSNADEELKDIADIVLTRPSGYGFIELAHMIIHGKIPKTKI
ncbi:MAG: phosphoglycolate phosphatase [Desulfurococcales archaeon]|nr:phosphoglycolate phosphatase [Desulfurococcales archaeon]